VMYAGRIVERGPVAELIRAPRHPYTRGLLDSLPHGRSAGGRLTPIRGAAPPLSRLPPGCAFAPRCPRAVAACAEPPPLAAAGGREFRCIRPL
jgi:peptide/nickel transport system ATP-binding protein